MFESRTEFLRSVGGVGLSSKSKMLGVVGAAAMMLATPALAGADIYRRGDHGPRVHISFGDRGYAQHRSLAGTLCIDGERIRISSRGCIETQIVRAFRRCGYDAQIERGRVVVCYRRGHGPRVSWQARGYRADIDRSSGRLCMSVYKPRSRSSWGHSSRGSWDTHWSYDWSYGRDRWSDRRGRRGCGR